MFLSTLYVIGLPYSRQHCAYNQPVYIFLFHVDFILEDIMVSRSLRQAMDPMNPELPDTPVIGALSKLTPSSLHVPVSKEVSGPTASGAISKLEQSSLYDQGNRKVSVPTAAWDLCNPGKSSPYHTENKEVSVSTTAGTEHRLEQSSLHDPESKEVSVPSAASVVRKPSIIDGLKSFFGVRKEVKEIKISVTPEEFLKKSWKVGKKKLHRRKIVPVIIWDFGGQDVFYSTHQTFLTYRAIYMLVLDGSRTLDEPCPFEQYLPGKGGAKTQRGSRSFLYIGYDV